MGTVIFDAIVWVLPIAVLARAYWKYLQYDIGEQNDLARVRVSLFLASASAIAWLINFGLISIDEHSHLSRATIDFAVNYRIHGPVGLLIFGNLVLGLCCVALCWFKRAAHPSTVPLKKAVSLAGEILLVLWLLLAANPH